MTPVRQSLLVAVFLVLAAVLQGRAAHGLNIRGAQPDLPLLVLACGATLVGNPRAALLGLLAGLLQAALLPLNVGSEMASRTLAGAFAGALGRIVIRDSLLTPLLVVLAATLVAEGVYLLLAPGQFLQSWASARAWALGAGGEALYNTALALPVYFLLRRLRVGDVREDPFALRG